MIYRTDKRKNKFTQVDNNIITNKNLSAQAKGVLLYLLAQTDNWQFYQSEIANHFTDSEKIISNILKELEEAGYVEKTKCKSKKGTYIWVYDIYENPILKNDKDNNEIDSWD